MGPLSRVLCSCPSPSGWQLKDGRGQIMNTTTLEQQNNVRVVRRPRSSHRRSNTDVHNESRFLEYVVAHGSPLAHMSCQITIMSRERAVPGDLQYTGALVSLCKDRGTAANGFSSSSIRYEPQTSHVVTFIRTNKCYCCRVKKLRLLCLQRRGKSLLWPEAPMEWVLKGSLMTSMMCRAQQEGSCPEICFGIWGHQCKFILLLILKKQLPACFSAALAVYPIKNTSINALGFLGGDEGGSHAGLWLLS